MAISVLCSLIVPGHSVFAQAATPSPSPAACAPIPPSCPAGVAPGVLKLVPDQNNKYKLARQHFYLSSCPFNLAASVDFSKLPSRKSYYGEINVSPELIEWLEVNNCDTVYCRELTPEEVTCKVGDKGCVPEFVRSYQAALAKLKVSDKARKWITMYGPLAEEKFRVGLYLARKAWLEAAVRRLESSMKERANGFTEGPFIRSVIADDEGEIFFYDLCPTTPGVVYYFSTIAPLESGGKMLYWESPLANRITDSLNPTTPMTVTLATPTGDPNKDKDSQKKLMGKPVPRRGPEQKPTGP